jgi:hypothetical protein
MIYVSDKNFGKVDITQENITVNRGMEASRNFIQNTQGTLWLPHSDKADVFDLYTTLQDSEWHEKETEHSVSKLTVKEQTKTGTHMRN